MEVEGEIKSVPFFLFLTEGCSVTIEVLSEHASQTILQYLGKYRLRLVVTGSRGLSRAERPQLGSVSESVVKYAPWSVLVTRGPHV